MAAALHKRKRAAKKALGAKRGLRSKYTLTHMARSMLRTMNKNQLRELVH